MAEGLAARAARVLIGLASLVALIGAGGCKGHRVQSNVTGVSLTVHYDVNAGLNALKVAGFAGTAAVFEPGTLPDPPRPLTKGTETLTILLPDALAGQMILIRVDGLANDVLKSSGAQTVTLERARLVDADVKMEAAAVCGDGVKRKGFEECDDGNTLPGDGCSPDCMIEPAAACGPVTCASGCCQDGMCAPRALATCGTAGAACIACPPGQADTCSEAGGCACGSGPVCAAGQVCANGVCVCDEKNCGQGCCEGNVCVAPSLKTCGLKAVRCVACDPTKADRCDAAGTCACGGGPACPAGQSCDGGQCVCTDKSCPSGCCDLNTCKTRSLTTCGDEGSTCVACNMQADNCSATGTCRCGNDMPCLKGQRCIGGTCMCDGTSCPDGCCSGGRCLPGDTADSCGGGGGTCDVCPAGESCVDGRCSGCNVSTCQNGCCSGKTCNPPSVSTCGVGSAVCAGCDVRRADRCSAVGACACGTGPMCPAGSRCVDGQCVCKANSCPNGCCLGGACVELAINYCGTAGGTCTECSLTTADNCSTAGVCSCGLGPACATRQRCVAGNCICDATSCPNGCCDGNVCRAQAATSCGGPGGVCRDCGIKADRCTTGGNCRCGNGPMCADGNRCVNGACVCDGTSCPTGCCSKDGVCLTGTDSTACGSGGAECQDCGGNGACASGVCNSCTATSCPLGCCSGSRCNMPTLVACGTNGAACVSCDVARADTCSASGACSCGTQPACGTGKRCVGGSCVCDAVSCPGGCCSGGACQALSTSTCGLAGVACVACAAGKADICDAATGTCMCGTKPPCGPGTVCEGGTCTCNEASCPKGCCASGVCMDPPSFASCGFDGETCVACDTTAADNCSATGACMCGASAPCATGSHCTAGACVPDA